MIWLLDKSEDETQIVRNTITLDNVHDSKEFLYGVIAYQEAGFPLITPQLRFYSAWNCTQRYCFNLFPYIRKQ